MFVSLLMLVVVRARIHRLSGNHATRYVSIVDFTLSAR